LPAHSCRHASDGRFRHDSTIPRRGAPEVCWKFPPPKQRAWGMPGAQCTRSLACESSGVECTRVFTASSPETPGIPARNGFTAYSGLSPVIGLSCHRRRADIGCARPVGPAKPPRDLTPASRRQDHTLSPYATRLHQRPRRTWYRSRELWRRRKKHRSSARRCMLTGQSPPCITCRARRCRVHRIPPRVRDDRDTPLLWDETAVDID
jgi:hypothetical protein